jgi:hypothetical protein
MRSASAPCKQFTAKAPIHGAISRMTVRNQAMIVLLHALELPRMQINPEIFNALQGSQAVLERLEPLCREFRPFGVECTAQVRAGVPHDEMLSAAEPDGSGKGRFLFETPN